MAVGVTGGGDDYDGIDVDGLRHALTSGQGLPGALRGALERSPLFLLLLFIGAVRNRYEPGCDVREITRFVASVRARHDEAAAGFRAREAEALMRAALGETELIGAVDPSKADYGEIAIAVMARLFEEWTPSPRQAAELIEQTADVKRLVEDVSAGLGPAEMLRLAESLRSPSLSESEAERILAGERVRENGGAGPAYGEQMMAGHRDDPQVVGGQALALNVEGRHAEALACYNRAVAVAPSNPALITDRAGTYLMLGHCRPG